MSGSPNGTPPTVIPLEQAFPDVIPPDPVQRLTVVSAPVGARVLVRKSRLVGTDLFEVLVLEWAPSGTRVKLRSPAGRDEWSEGEDVPEFVEQLEGIK